MSGFYYETLTINGITKICDNKIYINNERTVINYQWHKFQLKYIIESILHLSAKDPITGLELSKEYMCELIKDSISSTPNFILKSDNPDKDRQMGIVPKKTLDKISIDNMGGIPNKHLLLDPYGLKLTNTADVEYVYEEEYKKLYHSKTKSFDNTTHLSGIKPSQKPFRRKPKKSKIIWNMVITDRITKSLKFCISKQTLAVPKNNKTSKGGATEL